MVALRKVWLTARSSARRPRSPSTQSNANTFNQRFSGEDLMDGKNWERNRPGCTVTRLAERNSLELVAHRKVFGATPNTAGATPALPIHPIQRRQI